MTFDIMARNGAMGRAVENNPMHPNWIISVKYSLLVPLKQGCAAIFSISDSDADELGLVVAG